MYRMKGLLAIHGSDYRYVYHVGARAWGVRELLSARVHAALCAGRRRAVAVAGGGARLGWLRAKLKCIGHVGVAGRGAGPGLEGA